MGMWTYAELSTGIVISCLPVIPRFFQHIGPKLSSAFTLRSKYTKDFGIEAASTTPSDKFRTEKLKLPSFKHTFTSVVSTAKKDNDHELDSQQSLPKGEYVKLREDAAFPRRNASKDITPMPAARLATARDDLESGYGRI